MDRLRCPDPGEINIGGPVQVGNTIGFFLINKANQGTLFQIAKELQTQVKEFKSKSAAEVKWPEWEPMPLFRITNFGTLGPVEEAHGCAGRVTPTRLIICSILEKPVVKEGQIMIRQMMNACLDWDHRAMMANTPVEFLTQLKKNLEEPSAYLV
jgi:pyruvate dehydrogenase E2 component (dihydrolipoamide acetyltransferase)